MAAAFTHLSLSHIKGNATSDLFDQLVHCYRGIWFRHDLSTALLYDKDYPLLTKVTQDKGVDYQGLHLTTQGDCIK